MWFSVELLKLHWFGINWHVFNRSECRNCCLYTIIQKIAPPTESGKYFQIWFSPDLGGNGGVLSMRMQVILDSSFARPGLVPTGGGKKEEFRDWTKRGHHTFTCSIICWKTRFCFFLWLVEKQYLWFAVFWLAVIFQLHFRPEVGQKTEWWRRREVLRGWVFFCV